MATQTTITDWPPEVKEYILDIMEKAQKQSEAPYETYDKDRIAGFTDDQEAVMKSIMDYTGQGGGIQDLMDNFYKTDPTTGEKTLKEYDFTPDKIGTKSWTDEGVAESYMNPYEDLVVDKMRRQTEDAMLQARQKDMASAVGRGAFGGSREAANTAIGQQSYLDRLANAEADLFYKGYDQGAKIFGKDADRSLKADTSNVAYGLEADKLGTLADFNRVSALEGLARTDQSLFADEMALKGSVGDARQKMGQSNLDLAYGDFLKQQQYPYQQLDYYSGIVRGHQPNIGAGSLTQQTKDPSFLQQALGLGINALGLYGMGGGFSGDFNWGNLFK
tara:strand:+ start:1161 stop:2156 length:996 start_codon:yes stop_codon:yes gene_type:complete